MRPVHADFRRRAPPPRWLWWALGLLMTGVLACGAHAWQAWLGVHRQTEQLREALTARAVPGEAPAIRSAPSYEASARELLAEHRFPWAQALTSLETTAVVGVTPSAVEFLVAEGQIRADVSFVDYVKLLEYLDQLNAGEPELRWTLVQAQMQGGASSALIAGSVVSR